MVKFFYIVFAIILLSSCDTKTGDQAEVTGDQAEVAGDQVEVTGDQAEVAGDQVEVTGDQAEAAGDQVEVTGDQVDVTGDQAEATGEDQLSKEALNENLFGSFDAVKEALEKGANVNTLQKHHFHNLQITPLHDAAGLGRNKIVKLLLDQKGIEINENSNALRMTPLIWAVFGLGDKTTVELLVAHGSDITLKDVDGKTAYDHAKESKRKSRTYDDLQDIKRLLQPDAPPYLQSP